MTVQELVERLREYAEWAEANIWEVPIMLPDVLTTAEDVKSIIHLERLPHLRSQGAREERI